MPGGCYRGACRDAKESETPGSLVAGSGMRWRTCPTLRVPPNGPSLDLLPPFDTNLWSLFGSFRPHFAPISCLLALSFDGGKNQRKRVHCPGKWESSRGQGGPIHENILIPDQIGHPWIKTQQSTQSKTAEEKVLIRTAACCLASSEGWSCLSGVDL